MFDVNVSHVNLKFELLLINTHVHLSFSFSSQSNVTGDTVLVLVAVLAVSVVLVTAVLRERCAVTAAEDSVHPLVAEAVADVARALHSRAYLVPA